MLFPNHNVALFDSSDVYVIGRDGNYAMLWKNGIAAKLSNGSVPAGANAVFVDNGKIYVAGFEGDKVRLWIDGVGQDLIYGTNAMSVVVKDKDVYDGTEAKLRIDSSQGYLTVMSRANDIGVPGNETFVAGIGKNVSPLPSMFTYARLYVGGTVINLSHGASDATANAVFVMDK